MTVKAWQRGSMGAGFFRCAALGALGLLSFPSMVMAQFGPLRGRATVIENVTIELMNGQTISNGVIILRGDRIEAVGTGLEIPDNATKVDGQGGWVTPGLIDVSGSIGLVDRSGSSPIHRALDGFDPYASEEFREAVRHGVTAYYLPARGGGGIDGVGTVIRLAPRDEGGVGQVLVEDAALCIDMGSSAGAIARLNTYSNLRDAFKNAKAYRESLETYEEDLKEYIEKIEKRAKEEAKAKQSGEGEKKKSEEGEKQPPGVADADAPPTQDPRRRQRPPGGGPPNGAPPAGPSNGSGNGANGKDEIKRPTKPAPNRAAEKLLKAIDGELKVRIVADRDEDILNALALADEYGLKIILEGATEAYRVADAIAEADVPVVLGPVEEAYGYRPGISRLANEAQCRILSDAGVKWLVGTGTGAELEGRFVLQAAQRVSAHMGGDGPLDPVQLVTRDAAEFLGVSDQIGRLGRGTLADLVLWSGDPEQADSQVLRTYVGGRLLYRAP